MGKQVSAQEAAAQEDIGPKYEGSTFTFSMKVENGCVMYSYYDPIAKRSWARFECLGAPQLNLASLKPGPVQVARPPKKPQPSHKSHETSKAP